MKHIQFFIEANKTSGLGRVRRCAVLAKAIKRHLTQEWQGAKISALTPESSLASSLLDSYGITQVRDIDTAASLVIVDGSPDYQFAVMDFIPHGASLVAVDDIANCRLPAQVVINPNLYAAQLDYSYLGHPRLLTGPKFHLIDPAFFPDPTAEIKRDIDILISFGGSQLEGYIQKLATALGPMASSLRIRIASPFPLSSPTIGGFPVLVGEDMQALLKRSRLYAGGGGATVLEALAAGCKIVATRVAQDQGMNMLALRMNDIDICDPFDGDRMAQAICQNLANPRDYAVSLSPDGPDLTAKALL